MRRALSKIHAPDAADVLAARKAAGHTQREASATIFVDPRTWQRWEAGVGGMSPGHWELYLIKTGAKRAP